MSKAEGFFPDQTPVKIARHIRWLIRRDMPSVLKIETASQDYPLTEEEILAILRQRNAIGLVVQEDEAILGYCCYELQKDEIELLVLAVDPRHQRRGVGRLLVERLFHKLNQQGRRKLKCVTRDTEVVAHRFLKAVGMKAVKVIREGFLDGSDAYCFEYTKEAVET